MNVKQAIAAAKQYTREIFADEAIDNVGLEEVEFDDDKNVWAVTIGFSRPWLNDNMPASLQIFPQKRRDYKVIRIDDGSKKILSVKNRETVV